MYVKRLKRVKVEAVFLLIKCMVKQNMLWIIVILIAVVLIVGPSAWVKFTLKRYATERKDLPGTGGELATHLLKRFELNDVKVETTQEGQDHFDYGQHVVRLSPSVLAVIVQLAILPEEWDASFNKALPILREGNYIPQEDLPKVKKILTACAMTYVAAALIKVLFVWRWFKR